MFLREFTNGVCVGWQDVDTVSIRRQLHPARYYTVSLVTLDFRMVLCRLARANMPQSRITRARPRRTPSFGTRLPAKASAA
jgi:hypothetical protein